MNQTTIAPEYTLGVSSISPVLCLDSKPCLVVSSAYQIVARLACSSLSSHKEFYKTQKQTNNNWCLLDYPIAQLLYWSYNHQDCLK